MWLDPAAGWPPWAGSGQNWVRSPPWGSPTVAYSPSDPAVLLPFDPLNARVRRSEERQPAGGQSLHYSVGPGRGASRGRAARAELRLSLGLEEFWFLCHVCRDFFPVRFGLNKGSAASKRFKPADPAPAFVVLIKKVDPGEGPWPALATQAHVGRIWRRLSPAEHSILPWVINHSVTQPGDTQVRAISL